MRTHHCARRSCRVKAGNGLPLIFATKLEALLSKISEYAVQLRFPLIGNKVLSPNHKKLLKSIMPLQPTVTLREVAFSRHPPNQNSSIRLPDSSSVIHDPNTTRFRVHWWSVLCHSRPMTGTTYGQLLMENPAPDKRCFPRKSGTW